MAVFPRADTFTQRQRQESIVSSTGVTDSFRWVYASNSFYSDGPTVRRKRPLFPELLPTSLKRFRLGGYNGDVNFQCTMGRETYVYTKAAFSAFWWTDVPGVSMAFNTPSILRNYELEAALGNKLLTKIKDRSLQVPVTIVEARKTASWLSQNVSSIARGLLGLKNGNWAHLWDAVNGRTGPAPRSITVAMGRFGYSIPKRNQLSGKRNEPPSNWSSQTASQRWLEYQYALKPLLADVDGLAKALADYIYEYRFKLVSRRAMLVDYKERQFTKDCKGGDMRLFDYPKVSIRAQSAIRYNTKVFYTFDESYMGAFARKAKALGFVNAPSAIWELVPYSFVGDWAITIGDYLELLDATVGCTFQSGTLTRSLKSRSSEVSLDLGKGVVGWPLIDRGIVPSAYTCNCMERDVLTGFPTPAVIVKSPFSTSHALSALALLRLLK